MKFIYFVRGQNSGLIKIGSAKNPKKRVADLQTGNAEPLELLGMIPEDGRTSEGMIHAGFAHDRVHGEWYAPGPRLWNVIRTSSLTPDFPGYGLPVGTRIRTPGVLGSLIKAYRMKRGLTQAELAAKMRASRQWVVKIERGATRADVGLVFGAIQVLDIPLGVVKS